MIKYKVVVDDSLLQFTEEVESLRNDGWNHVEGGFVVCNGKYYREMEKYVPLEDVAHEVAQAVSPWKVIETPPVIASPTQSTSAGVTSVSSCPYKAVPEY